MTRCVGRPGLPVWGAAPPPRLRCRSPPASSETTKSPLARARAGGRGMSARPLEVCRRPRTCVPSGGALAALLLLVALTGCGATVRSVRLDTGQGEPLVHVPHGGHTPVELKRTELTRALRERARDVRPPLRPQEAARRLFAVEARSGTYQYESPGRLTPLGPGGHVEGRAQATEVELTHAYLRWCERTGRPGDCLRLLEETPCVTGDGRYALAMALAQGAVLDEMLEAFKDELREAGERYAKVMGRNAARAFALLATAAIGNTAAGLATKVPTLPGAVVAATRAETQMGLRLAAVGEVETVAVSAGSVTLALAPSAVAMSARDTPGTGGSTGKRTEHGQQRAEEARAGDAHRQVGDANRVLREGRKFIDTETGNTVHVAGDRVVITDTAGELVTQFKNPKANTQARIQSGRWVPVHE
jgi:hypothetical protein